MQDGIIKGTGNSRYLKSISNFLEQYPTYQDFVTALVAGTLPVDFNGINPTGWDQLGTSLNTENLLNTEVASLYGLGETGTINDCLKILANNRNKILVNEQSVITQGQSVVVEIPLIAESGTADTYQIVIENKQSLLVGQYPSFTVSDTRVIDGSNSSAPTWDSGKVVSFGSTPQFMTPTRSAPNIYTSQWFGSITITPRGNAGLTNEISAFRVGAVNPDGANPYALAQYNISLSSPLNSYKFMRLTLSNFAAGSTTVKLYKYI